MHNRTWRSSLSPTCPDVRMSGCPDQEINTDRSLVSSNILTGESYTMDYLKGIDLKDRDTQYVAAGAAITAIGAGYLAKRAIKKRRESAPIAAGPFSSETLPKGCYDAIIVGAGTSAGMNS
jgi:hypothetical protein